jgi:photosystem II stability/assembly factor-like uncharacterized protein
MVQMYIHVIFYFATNSNSMLMLKTSFICLAFLCLSVCTSSCKNADSASAQPPSTTAENTENLGTQWVPVALNDKDETVSAFVMTKKGRLIAGTSAGVFLSDDKGQAWSPATINPDDKAAVFSLAIDAEGTIYAGLSRYGVLVSDDNGNSWKLYNTGLNKGGPRSSYAILAAGSNILKGTLESGVYLSADKGKTWQPSNNGIPLNLMDNKMVSVSQLVQNEHTVYALTDLGVRYSNDKGKTWNKPAHNGIERLGYMQSLAVNKSNLFTGVGTSLQGVLVSADNGENWKASGLSGKPVSALFTATTGVVYAGAEGEIFRSADNGITWTAAGTGLPPKSAVYAIGITPEGKLLAGINRKGIYLLK